MRVVFVFIDGMGLGKDDPSVNPLVHSGFVHLTCFDGSHEVLEDGYNGFLVPTDATLGLDGLPQSATGQSTLFTGVNCAKFLNRHLQGYPNEILRNVLKERSILKQVKLAKRKAAFINAYRPFFFTLKESIQWRLSATTVANLSAKLPFFQISDILKRRSLYHDFTNELLIKRGFDVPLFSPEEAGAILGHLSDEYDLTLYEYFLTDRAGHSQQMQTALYEIGKLDRFLSGFLKTVDLEKTLVLLASDHGNIEDLSVKTHTRNQAVTLLWGKKSEEIKNQIQTLEDIAPVLMDVLQIPELRKSR